jgi:hypothetical protein
LLLVAPCLLIVVDCWMTLSKAPGKIRWFCVRIYLSIEKLVTLIVRGELKIGSKTIICKIQ